MKIKQQKSSEKFQIFLPKKHDESTVVNVDGITYLRISNLDRLKNAIVFDDNRIFTINK